jgi:hypothetical protein
MSSERIWSRLFIRGSSLVSQGRLKRESPERRGFRQEETQWPESHLLHPSL